MNGLMPSEDDLNKKAKEIKYGAICYEFVVHAGKITFVEKKIIVKEKLTD